MVVPKTNKNSSYAYGNVRASRADARSLITAMGYRRRKAENADARRAVRDERLTGENLAPAAALGQIATLRGRRRRAQPADSVSLYGLIVIH